MKCRHVYDCLKLFSPEKNDYIKKIFINNLFSY